MTPDNKSEPKNPEKKIPVSTSANIQEIIKKGNEIYDTLKSELESTNNGQYIVIDIDSGKYFTGDTRDEATANARKEFPIKVMFVRRIGQLEKASRHLPIHYSRSYARLF